MKKFRLHAIVAGGAVLLLLILFTLLFSSQRTFQPFRCSGFTLYNLSRNNNDLEFHLAQDLRFLSNASGYFVFNGRVENNGKTTVLNRNIVLGKGGKIDEDTWQYHISDIIAAPTDNTPDPVFNQLFSELVTDKNTLMLDVVHIQDQAWLIGSPTTYLFTCVAY